MSIEISRETETCLNDEARRHGISVDVLLERLMNERRATDYGAVSTPRLPVLHLGAMGPLHRRDIYDDVR
jgi:hypothetical protein